MSHGYPADLQVLPRVLGLSEDQLILGLASVARGAVKMWDVKYKALVDGSDTAHVKGSAHQVKKQEDEEALLFYETENYEVVRCTIAINEGEK